MTDLERTLRGAELPDEARARERARQTVLAAHAEIPRHRRGRAAAVWLAVVAAAAAVVASQLSPAHALEGVWHRIVAEPAATATPLPDELPARGRLLITDRDALWLVERDGRRRRLGAWTDATWSPKGLFIGVTAGHTLAAIEPRTGHLRWRLTQPTAVSVPRWAPDGMHIAYRSGSTLRIV